MKCLSVQQPWAHAIIHLEKRIENRTWRTNHRGPLAIHASKSRGRLGDLAAMGLHESPEEAMAFGAVIGIVEVLDCVPLAEASGPYAEGPWCWLLGSPLAITPFAYRGRTLLFDVPELDRIWRRLRDSPRREK